MQTTTRKPHLGSLAFALLLGLFTFVFVRNAWVVDDAYISFRTVDNFLSGHGLGQNGRVLGGCRFAHFTAPSMPGMIVELIELDDALAAAFDAFKTAASEWDGSEPVRDLPL